MVRFETFFSLNRKLTTEGILWNQGAGGNTSIKSGDILFIKPSGKRIGEIQEKGHLSQVKTEDLKSKLFQLFNNKEPSTFEVQYKTSLEEATIKNSVRPSMECGFHACLSGEFVFHFHSVIAIGMAEIAAEKKESKNNLFKDWYEKNWQANFGKYTVIEPCLPGFELSRAIAESPEETKIYFLKNHGVVLNFNDESFLNDYLKFEEEAMKQFKPAAYSYYLEWKQKNYLELIETKRELLHGPLRFYFPDMAIMYPNIKNYLKKSDQDLYTFCNEKIVEGSSDQDALENWMAQNILIHFWPNLPELSEGLTKSIPQLPTELVRKKIIEEKS